MQISLPATKARDTLLLLERISEKARKTRTEDLLLQAAERLAERLRGIQRFLPTFAQDGGQIHFGAAETALLAALDALDRGETLSRHTALAIAQAVLDSLQPIAEADRRPVVQDA